MSSATFEELENRCEAHSLDKCEELWYDRINSALEAFMAFTTAEIKAVVANIGHSSTQPAVNSILTSHGITIQVLRQRMLEQLDRDYGDLMARRGQQNRWARFYGPQY